MKIINANTINENISLRVSPNWVGNWSTDTTCDKLTCCCLFDYINTSPVENGTKLQMIGQADGIGLCAQKPLLFTIIDMPKDFTLPFRLFDHPVNLSLSQDSQVISLISSVGPQCNTIAVRLNSAATRVEELFIVTLLLSLIGMKNFF